ncbi:hypothetical protein D3C75_1075020 [compost metagenome]
MGAVRRHFQPCFEPAPPAFPGGNGADVGLWGGFGLFITSGKQDKTLRVQHLDGPVPMDDCSASVTIKKVLTENMGNASIPITD